MHTDFKNKQLEFTAYLRDPANRPLPSDVKVERMAMYRELFFNNIESFLTDNFPVLKRIHNESQWLALVQDFYARHQSKSPYFVDIPEEFLTYLENERQGFDDYPFLLELAHYEWVELVLTIAKDELSGNRNTNENLLETLLSLSPLAWPLVYEFPVHRITPDYLPAKPPQQPTFLVVYRDLSYIVNFLEITPVTYRLLQIIQDEKNISGIDCLQKVAQEFNQTDPNLIIGNGMQILHDLEKKSILLASQS